MTKNISKDMVDEKAFAEMLEASDFAMLHQYSIRDALEAYLKAAKTSGMGDYDYQQKYERLKEFVRGKWKGDCSECAALANNVLNMESTLPPTSGGKGE